VGNSVYHGKRGADVAYDPALTTIIIGGVVIGVMVAVNGASDSGITAELARATGSWTAPLIARSYDNNSTGQKKLSKEASILQAHGYKAALQSGEGGHFKLGSAMVTGGLSLLAGTHTSGKIVVTYQHA
jgi:hypothetical protein